MDKMDKIVSLCKRRGFIFPSSEIYGGAGALWDYGELGVLMKNNLRDLWLKRFAQEREDVVLMDGSILMHPKVWQASGHLKSFTDPLIECKQCHARFRADLISSSAPSSAVKLRRRTKATADKNDKTCPECGSQDLTEPRQFNLMFKTFLGPVEDEAHQTYLRPETAQSMFVDFKLIQESARQKIPFGIAQIGRCFRNEITTGNFTFRAREFDLAEIEYFVQPGTDEKWFDYWLKQWEKFFLDLGLSKKNLRHFEHQKEDLAHYSKRTVDLEYNFPFGWSELAGVANRTDYDLKQHSQYSGQDLKYYDEESKKNYFPYVIEPTAGLDRAILAFLIEAYEEVKGGRTKTTQATKETEVVLRLDKRLAPIKVAVLPLVKNKKDLVKKARQVYDCLKPHFMCQYDEVGSIGRRYRRLDEIGCPFVLTADFETLEQDDVTIRYRDTMQQERIKIENLVEVLKEKLEGR